MSETPAGHAKHPPYVRIAIALGVITLVEVLVPVYLAPAMDWPRWLLVTSLLVMMLVKGVGVALYYMDLRFDSPAFSYLLGWPLVAAVVMILVFLVLFGMRPVTM